MSQYFDNVDLKSKINKISVEINNNSFVFYTDNGVFNKKGLDFGTRLLLENLSINDMTSFLDVGCGCGPIGIYIASLSDNYNVDMIDVNERAIHLCKKSIKENKLNNISVFKSDIYENVNNLYDCILTNPPIHAGKKKVYEIIEKSVNYLNKNGELWIVIRKDQGAESLIKDHKNIYNFEIIEKSKGFWILKGKKIN